MATGHAKALPIYLAMFKHAGNMEDNTSNGLMDSHACIMPQSNPSYNLTTRDTTIIQESNPSYNLTTGDTSIIPESNPSYNLTTIGNTSIVPQSNPSYNFTTIGGTSIVPESDGSDANALQGSLDNPSYIVGDVVPIEYAVYEDISFDPVYQEIPDELNTHSPTGQQVPALDPESVSLASSVDDRAADHHPPGITGVERDGGN